MLKLRKFLCGWFGFMALMFLLAPVFVVIILLSSHRNQPTPMVGAHLSVVAAFVALFLVPAGPFGMAWWTVKKGNAFARFWAIVASIEFVFMGLLPLLRMSIPGAYQRHSTTYRPHNFGIFEGILLALGIAGLVAFARRDAIAQPVIAAKPPRIAGDGTSRLLDGIAWIIGIAGYFAAMFYWHRWGMAQHLPRAYVGLLRLVAIILIITAVHELGHAATGLALGTC